LIRLARTLGHHVAHDLPPLRRREPLGVPLAQVVAVRFAADRERTEHGHGVRVVVREGGHGVFAAGHLAARSRAHRPEPTPSRAPRLATCPAPRPAHPRDWGTAIATAAASGRP